MSLLTMAKTVVLVLVLLVLQTSVLPQLFTTAFKPDLLLILVVFLSLRGDDITALGMTFGLGLLTDSVSSQYFGLHAFSYLVVFLFFRLMAGRLYVQSGFLIMLCACGGIVVGMLGELLLLGVFSESPGIFFSMVRGLFPVLVMQALFASLALPVARLLFPELEPR